MSKNTPASGGISWRISRTCDSGACVGVARRDEYILIGNTNDPNAPVNEFTAEEWRQFIAGVKLGDFDGIAWLPFERIMEVRVGERVGPYIRWFTPATHSACATAESLVDKGGMLMLASKRGLTA